MMKTVFIDMDDVLCDFTGAFNRAIKANPAIGYPQSQYGFFTGLKPLRGAVEAVKALIDSDRYQPYILTAPSVRNPLCYTEKRVWIEAQFGYEFTKSLIICAHKGLLKGDYLIDDNSAGKGQESFEGELIHYGSEVFSHWGKVREYLGV